MSRQARAVGTQTGRSAPPQKRGSIRWQRRDGLERGRLCEKKKSRTGRSSRALNSASSGKVLRGYPSAHTERRGRRGGLRTADRPRRSWGCVSAVGIPGTCCFCPFLHATCNDWGSDLPTRFGMNRAASAAVI